MTNRMFFRSAASMVLVLLGLAQIPAAPPTLEQLLPPTTTEFVAFPDVNRCSVNYQQTQLALLMHDAAMKPFFDEMNGNSKSFNVLLDTLGVDFESIKAAAGGEVGWAVAQPTPSEVAHVLTLDMTGKEAAAKKLLDELARCVEKKNGRATRRRLDGGIEVVVVEGVAQGRQLIYGVKDSVLVLTNHLPMLQGMLARWVGTATDSLANSPTYSHIRRQARPAEGETEQLRFFFVPLLRQEAQMLYSPALKKQKGTTFTENLRIEGVDGIKGVGGVIVFHTNGNDILMRACAHAPQPFRSSLRMAKLPNEVPALPDAWVPAGLSAHITFGFDMLNAYDAFGDLFDRLAGEKPGFFVNMMKCCAQDADGPCVDVRKEIMGQLQNRVTVYNDATRPYHEKAERYLIAIPTKDAAAEKILTEAIQKCFETDRRIKARDFNGARLWEYHVTQKKLKKDGKPQAVSMPSTSFTVTRGHLFLATQSSLLEHILKYDGPNLREAADYQALTKKLVSLGMGTTSLRAFLRLDVGFEATYEMMRSNRLDNAESAYAAWMRGLLIDETGKMRANGNKLPTYDQITRYLGLMGIFVTTDANGWNMVATILKK